MPQLFFTVRFAIYQMKGFTSMRLPGSRTQDSIITDMSPFPLHHQGVVAQRSKPAPRGKAKHIDGDEWKDWAQPWCTVSSDTYVDFHAQDGGCHTPQCEWSTLSLCYLGLTSVLKLDRAKPWAFGLQPGPQGQKAIFLKSQIMISIPLK